jgi:hypothetical protein
MGSPGSRGAMAAMVRVLREGHDSRRIRRIAKEYEVYLGQCGRASTTRTRACSSTAQWVDALVVECDPPNRLGFRSFGRAWTERGPLIASYHNWYIKPLRTKKMPGHFRRGGYRPGGALIANRK